MWIVTSPVVIFARSSARLNELATLEYRRPVRGFVNTQGVRLGCSANRAASVLLMGIRRTFPFFVRRNVM